MTRLIPISVTLDPNYNQFECCCFLTVNAVIRKNITIPSVFIHRKREKANSKQKAEKVPVIIINWHNDICATVVLCNFCTWVIHNGLVLSSMNAVAKYFQSKANRFYVLITTTLQQSRHRVPYDLQAPNCAIARRCFLFTRKMISRPWHTIPIAATDREYL